MGVQYGTHEEEVRDDLRPQVIAHWRERETIASWEFPPNIEVMGERGLVSRAVASVSARESGV